MTGHPPLLVCSADDLTSAVAGRVEKGARFCGLFARPDGSGLRLMAVVSCHGTLAAEEAVLPAGQRRYRSLTPEIPAAGWYERELYDLFGIEPEGHPRLDPLVLPRGPGTEAPCPGSGRTVAPIEPDLRPLPAHVRGEGVFTIPYGPVRSGVFESVEFLIETPGEDIPHLNIRPHYKHRGIAKQFEGRDVEDGVLVAERVEGIASVAHALAFCHAVEGIANVTVPPRARLLRVVYAELERIANHLEVALRLADAAGLAVATSRFGWHKESVMRLVSEMCGSRFGRTVVIPGGVIAEPALHPAAVGGALREIHRRIRKDLVLAMKTPSFIDRLRNTGILTPAKATSWAALGPVGRGSGISDDNRWQRPTDAYGELPMPSAPPVREAGDVMARANVRWDEIDQAAILAFEALQRLGSEDDPALSIPVHLPVGPAFGLGWAEAPQGEVLYALTINDGRIVRCFARSASLHNLAIFHDVFGGDVYTDFAFIEASFGLSYAGVAM